MILQGRYKLLTGQTGRADDGNGLLHSFTSCPYSVCCTPLYLIKLRGSTETNPKASPRVFSKFLDSFFA
jgi:hypothetical protein